MTTRAPSPDDAPMWSPGRARVLATQIHRFACELAAIGDVDARSADGLLDFAKLHAWSVAHPEHFWPAVWRYVGVIADTPPAGEPWTTVVRGFERLAPPDPALGPRWFEGARLNFAENLLRYRDDGEALIAWNEEGRQSAMSYATLAQQVQRLAAALRVHGIVPGDRVAAFMPNVPETIVAMLATASVGAVWTSCSPDFGVDGVLDRFGQVAPRLLIACDGYRYAGKEIDTLPRVAAIVDRIEAIERVVIVPSHGRHPDLRDIRRAVLWDEWMAAADDTPISFDRFPFDHPLYVMYSSGTTGLPKCMVHGAGGTLLQHLKEHVLHTDLTRGDRIFYFTTCGWMMWNWLVSALAVGATVVLYDGAPMPGASPDTLWRMAEAERVTVFGVSAKYLALAEKSGMRPGPRRDLSALRCILSTGSPLAPASYDFVYDSVKEDVQLSSISGGTDIISCFALGNPAAPVWRGELQAPGLGMAVNVFDEDGRPVRGVPGELVCTRPFPSMPVAFWNDPDGSRYRAAYFERYPNVWRHGDWAEFTSHGGLVITGRSDATLNPGGVRIGTADIYRQVEALPEVVESLVVGQEVVDAGDRDVRIVLFVRLREGDTLDDTLRERIRRRIREHTSPFHVPRVILAVADIPRTLSGKITELAVRDVIHGRPVRNTEALANPEALALFRDLPELRG